MHLKDNAVGTGRGITALGTSYHKSVKGNLHLLCWAEENIIQKEIEKSKYQKLLVVIALGFVCDAPVSFRGHALHKDFDFLSVIRNLYHSNYYNW